MTNFLFFARGAFFALFFSLFVISCGNDSEPQTITNTPEASVQTSVLNENSAKSFPQSLIFIGMMSESSYLLLFNSLPATQAMYEPLFTKIEHGNVTVLEQGGKVYGLIPAHLFGDDFDLLNALSKQGFLTQQADDLVTIRLKENQACLKAEPFDEIDTLFQGTDGTIRTLNCFQNENSITQFVITGKVFYIPADQMKQMVKGAKQTNGKLAKSEFSRGAYVVKIPKSLWVKVPGMSGGSLTAMIDGKERFLGLQTNRMILGGLEENGDTSKFFVLGFQPVLKKDLSSPD